MSEAKGWVVRAARSDRPFAALTLAGLVGYAACFATHHCMCGHRAHPPYGWPDDALDAGWVAAFAAAGVAVVARRGNDGVPWAVGLAALAALRLAVPPLMGVTLWLVELPVWSYLLLRSAWLLVAGGPSFVGDGRSS